MSKGDWDKLHDNYPQEIVFTREDLEDFLEDRDEPLTDKEWYEFREQVMDKITDLVQGNTIKENT